MFSSLDETERAQLNDRLAHVRELLTGYRSGDPTVPLQGEPRPAYEPARPRMERYAAKAEELGVGRSTLRRWVAAYQEQDVTGLLDLRHHRRADPLRHVDQRWLDTTTSAVRQLDEHRQRPHSGPTERARKMPRTPTGRCHGRTGQRGCS